MSFWRTLWSAVETGLDALLPRRERTVRTGVRTIEDIPVSPISRDVESMRITTLMEYRENAVEDLIRSLKYDGSAHAAGLCAEVLADFLREEISSVRTFSSRPIVLIPVPLHTSRERERGFNQIEIVLKKLSEEFKNGTLSSIELGALTRTRATEQQTHLSRSERMKNVADAFELKREKDLSGAHVFLIDDVTTTGATLINAAKPIEQFGAAVTLLALARA